MLRWLLVFSLAIVACGGRTPVAGGEKKVDLDADALALLPGSAVVVANVNARAVFDNPSVGPQIASIGSKLVPLGDDAGFQPARDLDRVVLASYATGALEIAAVLTGRFDTVKIAAATTSRNGALIVRGLYGGRTTYTVGGVQYAVLSAKTLIAGTGEELRRVLERIQAGTLERSMPPWTIATLETPGAQIAVAGDFETQPIVAAAIGSVSLPWLDGVHVARVIGNFEPPGMNVAATLTYGEPQKAQAAADGARSAAGLLKTFGRLLGGVRLENLEVTTDANDLRCKFAVDDSTLRTLLGLAPHFLSIAP